MATAIEAVFENGVFRPLGPVHLSEGTHVYVKTSLEELAEPPLPTVREILSRRYRSGQTDTAARHNEHQPW